MPGKEPERAPWTFLTNHSHVLICLAEDPDTRMRDVAERVGITERAVQRIIDDLAAEGYLRVEKEGRRNRYSIVPRLHLRHPVEGHVPVGRLVDLVSKGRPRS